MNEDRIPIPLNREERRIVFALRNVPESPLRTRILCLVKGLMDLALEPTCTQMQADGAPCASVHSQCDSCANVNGKIRALVSSATAPYVPDPFDGPPGA